jgi:hypothetical protein
MKAWLPAEYAYFPKAAIWFAALIADMKCQNQERLNSLAKRRTNKNESN